MEAQADAAELPLGWRHDAHGAQRRETIHSMLRRMNGWDYRQPWIYQVTLVCADRRAAHLGGIEVRRAGEAAWLPLHAARGAAIPPERVEARVAQSRLGEAILGLFLRFGAFTPEIRPLFCTVMPDHLHFIVQVVREMKRPLGNAVGGFKTGCEKLFRAHGGTGRLFAEGFQDSILFHAGQLGNMFRYLADNPRRRAIKALHPDLFRVVGRLAVPLSCVPGATAPGVGDTRLSPGARDGDTRLSPGARDLVPRAKATGYFSALGNRFLLERPLVQVQVSRRDFAYRREPGAGGSFKIVRDARGEPAVAVQTPLFAQKQAALFAAARRGAVLVSPCVSDGERQIARGALAAGLPLVALLNKGLAPLQKPGGRHFDACAAGRLLMLAPAAWPHRPGEKPMTRLDATAMNRLCQWIAGEGAAEINYHGMEPANIDALARAAAQVSDAP